MTLENAKKALDQAQSSTQGITLQFSSLKEAKSFRSCCYNVRSKDRKLNTKLYGIDAPQANSSPWDTLLLELDEKTNKLAISPATTQLFSIQAIDNETGEEVEL